MGVACPVHVLFGSMGIMGVGRGRVACPVLFGSLGEGGGLALCCLGHVGGGGGGLALCCLGHWGKGRGLPCVVWVIGGGVHGG